MLEVSKILIPPKLPMKPFLNASFAKSDTFPEVANVFVMPFLRS